MATLEDVDRAWMGFFKMPIGPFGMLDGVGIDTAWHITDYWAGRTGDAQLVRNAAFLEGYVDRSCVGVKSGEGFYRYPDPAFARPGFVESGTREVATMAGRSASPSTSPTTSSSSRRTASGAASSPTSGAR